MAIPLPKPQSDFTPPPAGTFLATCYRIIDEGTQKTTYMGDVSEKHKVLISWELHDEECINEKGDPLTVHKAYTWSMHKKSNLRKDLEGWRGRAFSEADFGEGGFDISKLLGVSCLIGITHDTREGETYANISSISKLPKGMEASKTTKNKKVCLWLAPGMFDPEVFESLSENLRKKIAASPEYQELMAMGEAAYDSGAKEDEEIPF